MIPVNGATRVFPVLAWPSEHVKAPSLFNAYFQRKGIDAVVVPFKVAPKRFVDTARTLMHVANVGGLVISIPHKPATFEAVDKVSPRASRAGACNIVYRQEDGTTVGDLIDGEGFVRGLMRLSSHAPFDWHGMRALVVGCGGVGRAIVEALAQKGVTDIGVFDSNPALAAQLQERIGAAYPGARIEQARPEAAGYDLVVNATPLGMHPEDPLPISLEGVASHCIVADCGMKMEMSKLLLEAQSRGCRIQKGKEMMLEQAPLYMQLFGWPGADYDDFRNLGVL